jgi:hypothetical protein
MTWTISSGRTISPEEGSSSHRLFSGRFPDACRIDVTSRAMLPSPRPVVASRMPAGMPAARLPDSWRMRCSPLEQGDAGFERTDSAGAGERSSNGPVRVAVGRSLHVHPLRTGHVSPGHRRRSGV